MSDFNLTVSEIRRDDEVVAYLRAANAMMKAFGYTEHGERHAGLVSHIAHHILTQLGYSARQAELAAIAGLMHDAGNLIHRDAHTLSGAMLAREILLRMEMPFDEIAIVMGAIGNHEEPIGVVANAVVAAVIIADKADVHTSRVQNSDPQTFDIHDRVNFAVRRSSVNVDNDAKLIMLDLEVDTTVCTVSEYFEIFLNRMLMCRRAAQFLKCQFALVINNNRLM